MNIKKIILTLSVIIFMMILTGCEERETVFELSAETFENFYTVSISDDADIINVDFEPIDKVSEISEDTDVTYKIFVNYTQNGFAFQNTDHKTVTLNADEATHEEHDIIFGNYELIDYSISIIDADGTITLSRGMNINDIESKTYHDLSEPNIYEAFDYTIEDQSLNDANLQSLISDLNDFDLLATEKVEYNVSQAATISYLGSTQNVSESINMKLAIDGSYMEIDDGDTRNVYQSYEDKYLLYGINKYKSGNGTYYVSFDVVDAPSAEDLAWMLDAEDTSSIEDIFDSTKVQITKDGSNYIIKALAFDMLTTEEKNDLIDQLESLGLEDIGDMTAEMHINIDAEHKTAEINLTIQFATLYLGEPFYMTTELDQEIIFDQYEEIDLSDESLYTVEEPDEFDEILYDTNFEEGIMDAPEEGLYRTYLEAGTYKITDNGGYRYEFYNESQQEIHIEFYGTNNIFIEEEGYYYVYLKHTVSDRDIHNIVFTNLGYENNYSESVSQVIDNGDGTYTWYCEGDADYTSFEFSIAGDSAVEFAQDSTDTLLIMGDSEYDYDFFNVDWKLWYTYSEGTYNITLHGYETQAYTFSMNIVSLDYYTSSDINEMEEIGDAYLENPIVSSEDLDNRYLKLVVTELSTYKFEFEYMVPELSHIAFNVYNAEDMNLRITTIYSTIQSVKLEPGTYVLVFDGASNPGVGYVKYIQTPYETNVDYYVTLETSEVIFNYGEEFPSIEYESQDDEQIIRIHFTLDEDSIIYSGEVDGVYKEDGTFVSKQWYDEVRNQVLFLEAGSYYFEIHPKISHSWTSYLYAAIITGAMDDDIIFGEEDSYITLGEQNDITRDYTNDYDAFILVITDAGNYVFTSPNQLFVFDENGNQILYSYNWSESIYLEAGTYYVFPRYATDYDNWFRVSFSDYQ